MKKTESKKFNSKFNLEKMKVASLKNTSAINGGYGYSADNGIRTVTDLGTKGNGATL